MRIYDIIMVVSINSTNQHTRVENSFKNYAEIFFTDIF